MPLSPVIVGKNEYFCNGLRACDYNNNVKKFKACHALLSEI